LIYFDIAKKNKAITTKNKWKKKHCCGQSWINMWNLRLGHEICQDFMSIVHSKSWGRDNLIEKLKINKNEIAKNKRQI
jgi:hypothetical protein